MNKKGDVNWSIIFSVIVVLVSFIIVLFVWWSMNIQSTTNKAVCHASVVFRATPPAAVQGYVPLKCKADKICIVSSKYGGDCKSEFGSSSAVTKIKVENKEQIEKILTLNIMDCWSMMGEGNLGLFSQGFLESYGLKEKVYPSCVVCTRVAFNQTSLEKAGIDLKSIDTLSYMQKHLISGKDITYADYFFKNGAAKFSVDETLFTEVGESLDKVYPLTRAVRLGVIDPSTNQISISQDLISGLSINSRDLEIIMGLGGKSLMTNGNGNIIIFGSSSIESDKEGYHVAQESEIPYSTSLQVDINSGGGKAPEAQRVFITEESPFQFYIIKGEPAHFLYMNLSNSANYYGGKFNVDPVTEGSITESITADNKKIGQIAIVFMQISVPSVTDVYKNIFATLGGVCTYAGVSSAYIVGPVKTVRAGATAARTVGRFCAAWPIGTAVCAILVAAPGLNTYFNYQTVAAGKCGDVDSTDGKRMGCSVVRTVNYDAAELTKYCTEL